jgi:hypothetical protein
VVHTRPLSSIRNHAHWQIIDVVREEVAVAMDRPPLLELVRPPCRLEMPDRLAADLEVVPVSRVGLSVIPSKAASEVGRGEHFLWHERRRFLL